MFVLCVLYNKDKMQSQDNQDKAVKQSTETEQKKNPAGNMDVSVVSVVFCQMEISATGRSPVQRNPTECHCANVCDTETRMRRPWPA